MSVIVIFLNLRIFFSVARQLRIVFLEIAKKHPGNVAGHGHTHVMVYAIVNRC